jgi:tetratricopeptide (TPR) repeat protein
MALSIRLSPGLHRQGRLFWLVLAVVAILVALVGWFLWPTRPPVPPVLKLDGVDPRVVAALQKARSAVELSPRSARVWGELGELLFANDFYTESLDCLRQAERLEPGEIRWPYLQGLALLLSEPDAAVAPLTRAVRGDPRGLAPCLRLAETLLERDTPDEAERLFRSVLDQDPENPRALLGLGLIAQRRDRWAESQPLLLEAAKSPFARKAAHTALAVAALRLHDEAAAERHRQEAEDAPRDPAWPDPYLDNLPTNRMSLTARIDFADRLLAQQKYGQAIEILREILEDHPGADEGRLKLAQVYIRAGQYGLAEKELRRLTTEHPDLADGRFLLGMVLLQGRKGLAGADQSKNEGEAETEFRRAIELRPGFALAYYNLGRCLQQQGKAEPARRAYEDALRHRPQLVIGHVALARLLRDQGERDAARGHLLQALRVQPDDPEAKKLLGEMTP